MAMLGTHKEEEEEEKEEEGAVEQGADGVEEGGGAGFDARPEADLGDDERAHCLERGEEDEEQDAWPSSVRYLWGFRRILGGSETWGPEPAAVVLRCCRRRVKWTFWL